MSETFDARVPLAVFEHAKRREWGLGIMVWEDQKKRGYLFENGQLRVLAEEFYPLMREVDRPEDEVQALYDALKPELDAALKQAGVEHRSLGPRHAQKTMTFDDQLALFRSEYPEGFQDPKWNETKRGVGARKRQPRHRDGVIARAQTELSSAALRAAIAQQQYRSVIDRAWAILRQTDLVSSSELAGSLSDHPESNAALAAALVELLHGESTHVVRFDRFVGAFRHAFQRAPGWQMATALPALVHPSEHVCVHPTSFRMQARWMAPRLVLPNVPGSASYVRCLTMVNLVASRLRGEAESPRDLMDVHDFVRATARSGAKPSVSALEKSRQTGRSAPVATVPESKPCPDEKD